MHIYRENRKLLVINNIYRLARAYFSCPLFSYTSLDFPSFLGSPFFFALLALEKSNNPLYFSRLTFLKICRDNL
jgi:hypothetical protein